MAYIKFSKYGLKMVRMLKAIDADIEVCVKSSEMMSCPLGVNNVVLYPESYLPYFSMM